MLERRGLKDRAWAVEWEASALEFLLERGFSPEMGARPLKRAIEQYVMAPLAATHRGAAVSGRRPVRVLPQRRARHPGRVRRSRQRYAAGRCPAGGGRARPAPDPGSMILAPTRHRRRIRRAGGGNRRHQADTRFAGLGTPQAHAVERDDRAGFLAGPAALRNAGASRAHGPGGGGGRHRRGLAQPARRGGRPARPTIRASSSSRLALQLIWSGKASRMCSKAPPSRSRSWSSPRFETGGGDGKATAAWCGQLREMYRAWSNNRHMQTSPRCTGGARRAIRRCCWSPDLAPTAC